MKLLNVEIINIHSYNNENSKVLALNKDIITKRTFCLKSLQLNQIQLVEYVLNERIQNWW